jgi:glycosyltransferase involved in cell wall biosynthesis
MRRDRKGCSLPIWVPVNIIFVCDEYPPRPHGGIGTFVQTLARALCCKGHGVTVVCLGEADEESSDDGIVVAGLRRSRVRYVGNLISRLRLYRWLAARVKSGEVDVVEAPDYMGPLPFGLKGCPTVIRLHLSSTAICIKAGKKIPKGISFYERRTLSSNSNWIAVSRYSMDLTKDTFGVSPKRSAVVYYPLPPAPSLLPEAQSLPANYVLYAGQMSYRKGALVLAEAARDVMHDWPDLHLVYVGGGISADGGRPISEHIRETVGPALAERVHFLGHLERERVLACMARARVFALPSRLETLGIVFLEAMALGVPVVCMKCPPGPEIVQDGVNGLLADPTSPKDVADKIRRLLDDPILASRLGRNGRRMVNERFSVERCVQETERFYGECIEALRSSG